MERDGRVNTPGCWHMPYAVIQIRESDGALQRFAIAYRREQVLRGFLVQRCILATGFSSADEATNSSSFMTGSRQCRSLSNRFRVFSLWATRVSARALKASLLPIEALKASALSK